jgi:hypothetical protein
MVGLVARHQPAVAWDETATITRSRDMGVHESLWAKRLSEYFDDAEMVEGRDAQGIARLGRGDR